MQKLDIDDSSAHQRLDRFLRKYFKQTPEITLGDIFSRIRKGSIKVNNQKKKQSYRLQLGDTVSRDDRVVTDKQARTALQKKTTKKATLSLHQIQKLLIHETDDLLIWNKPAHMLVHPGDKHTSDLTLHDYMVSYLQQTDQQTATQTFTPSLCYRLDKDTSGVVISAKTYPALQYMNQIIRDRQVDKRYTTILVGDISNLTLSHANTSKQRTIYKKNSNQIHITAPLFVGYNRSTGRSQTFINAQKGKPSASAFFPTQVYEHPVLGPLTLAQVKIETGRMHQIRVHAAHLGYPILGDLTYGNPMKNRIATKKCSITRQLLHATSYSFVDPTSQEKITYTASLPEMFTTLYPTKKL